MSAGAKLLVVNILMSLEIRPPPSGAQNLVGCNSLLQPLQPKISNFNAPNSLSSGAERVGSFADLSMSLVPSLGQLSADRAHSWIKRAGAEPLTRQAVLCRFTPDVLLASSSQQLPREMDRTWLSIHVLNLIFGRFSSMHPVHLLLNFLQPSLDRGHICPKGATQHGQVFASCRLAL